MPWTFPKLVPRSAPVILLVLTLAAAVAFAAVSHLVARFTANQQARGRTLYAAGPRRCQRRPVMTTPSPLSAPPSPAIPPTPSISSAWPAPCATATIPAVSTKPNPTLSLSGSARRRMPPSIWLSPASPPTAAPSKTPPATTTTPCTESGTPILTPTAAKLASSSSSSCSRKTLRPRPNPNSWPSPPPCRPIPRPISRPRNSSSKLRTIPARSPSIRKFSASNPPTPQPSPAQARPPTAPAITAPPNAICRPQSMPIREDADSRQLLDYRRS